MPDDRLFHKRAGHSAKVNMLTSDEEIVWRTYIQAADDFGVMRFSIEPLRDAHDRLGKLRPKSLEKMLWRVKSVDLVRTFEHQGRLYCYQWDWQDYQKIRYALSTIHPRIPAEILRTCSIATQWLHTLYPGGGGRDQKLSNWAPGKNWIPPNWTDGSGNGSGNGSTPSRARRSDRPIPVPVPIPVSTNQLELVPAVLVHPYESTKAPAHSRRPAESLLKTHDSTDVEASSLEGADVRSALRDCQRTDHGRSDDRRLRVEAPDQGPPAATAVRAADALGSYSQGDVGGGEGARAGVGAAAHDSTVAGGATSGAAGSALAWPFAWDGRIHDRSGADDRAREEHADGVKSLVRNLRLMAGGAR